MSPALPAFQRATRIAEALFSGGEASVILVDGERVWRSGGSLVGTKTPALGARLVIARGKSVWVADRPPIRPSTPDAPARFWAGAPLRLSDGATIGVLTVMGARPGPTTRRWPRACRTWPMGSPTSASAPGRRDRAQRDDELRQARKVMAAFVSAIPIGR